MSRTTVPAKEHARVNRSGKRCAPREQHPSDGLLEASVVTFEELLAELPTLTRKSCDDLFDRLFHPADRVRLCIKPSDLPAFLRLLSAHFIVLMNEGPNVGESDNKARVSKEDVCGNEKAPYGTCLAAAAGYSPSEFQEQYRAGLPKFRSQIAEASGSLTSHLPRMSSSQAFGVVRALEIPALMLPWLSAADGYEFASLTYSGNATYMRGGRFLVAPFQYEGKATCFYELLRGDIDSTQQLFAQHGLVDAEVLAQLRPLASMNAATGSDVVRDCVSPNFLSSRLPQILWDLPEKTIAVTPVPPIRLLSLIRDFARSDVRAERIIYGGENPQNVSAYNGKLRSVPSLLAEVPRLSFTSDAELAARIFHPTSLHTIQRLRIQSDALSGLRGRPNRVIENRLKRVAHSVVTQLCGPLFELRELVELGSPYLTDRHLVTLEESQDPALLYVKGKATEEALDVLAHRFREITYRAVKNRDLSAEWDRYFFSYLKNELRTAQ